MMSSVESIDPSDGSSTADFEDADAAEPTEEEAVRGVELALDQISPEALRGLIEEYITREGTDYGNTGSSLGGAADPHAERTLEEKVAQVRRQLEDGEARIVFDLEEESASIVHSDLLADALGER